MGNYKWNTNNENIEEPFVVVLMISRNKDNKNIKDFKERRWAFVTRKNEKHINSMFNSFINEGVPGEFCRLYITLNSRDMAKVRKELIHILIDKEDFNFNYLDPIVAGLAAKKENAAERKWFFDFDSLDEEKLSEFVYDIVQELDTGDWVHPQRTPHGYAVIVSHGFDTRNLMRKWGEIASLKRDDLICVNWSTKHEYA